MSETTGVQGVGNPYKIVDHTRERRKGITASSLKELTNVARNRLAFPVDADLTIVLEQDGKETFMLQHTAIVSSNISLILDVYNNLLQNKCVVRINHYNCLYKG